MSAFDLSKEPCSRCCLNSVELVDLDASISLDKVLAAEPKFFFLHFQMNLLLHHVNGGLELGTFASAKHIINMGNENATELPLDDQVKERRLDFRHLPTMRDQSAI